jgi:HPt (histidine-containing phosphotransfer) domain-containing protein
MNESTVQNRKTIDLEDLLHRIGGIRHIVDELLELFVETTEPKLGQMEQAIGTENWDALDKLTHELKGASGNISAAAFLATILEMRDHLRTRKTELLGADMARLRADFERVGTFVAELKSKKQP